MMMSKTYLIIFFSISLCFAQKNVACRYSDYDTTGQTSSLLKEVEYDCGMYSVYSVSCFSDSSFLYKFTIGVQPISSLKIRPEDFLKTIYALSCKTFKYFKKHDASLDLKKEILYLEQNKRVEKIVIFDTLVRDSFYYAYIESLFDGDSLIKRSYKDSVFAEHSKKRNVKQELRLH